MNELKELKEYLIETGQRQLLRKIEAAGVFMIQSDTCTKYYNVATGKCYAIDLLCTHKFYDKLPKMPKMIKEKVLTDDYSTTFFENGEIEVESRVESRNRKGFEIREVMFKDGVEVAE